MLVIVNSIWINFDVFLATDIGHRVQYNNRSNNARVLQDPTRSCSSTAVRGTVSAQTEVDWRAFALQGQRSYIPCLHHAECFQFATYRIILKDTLWRVVSRGDSDGVQSLAIDESKSLTTDMLPNNDSYTYIPTLI